MLPSPHGSTGAIIGARLLLVHDEDGPAQQQTGQAEALKRKEPGSLTLPLKTTSICTNASGKNQVFSGFSEEYSKQSRVKRKVYKMS